MPTRCGVMPLRNRACAAALAGLLALGMLFVGSERPASASVVADGMASAAAPAPTTTLGLRTGPPPTVETSLHGRVHVSGPGGRTVPLLRRADEPRRTKATAQRAGQDVGSLRAGRVQRTSALSTVASVPALGFGLNVWRTGDVAGFDSAIGVRSSIVGIYRDWVHYPDFPARDAAAIRARGATPMIAWEPWDSWDARLNQPAFTADQITAGRYDGLLRRWADQARGYGYPVLIRLAPEQNGNWRPWSVGVLGNTAADYVRAWRHVVGIFRNRGAANVAWVWNPIVAAGESTPMAASYPGDGYVDRIGVDGFNWGSSRPWGWQDYQTIFGSTVTALKAFAPTKPWFLAEVASAPGSKRPAWILDTFARARRDGATAVVWFEFNKETDWRLSVDPASCLAVRQALAG